MIIGCAGFSILCERIRRAISHGNPLHGMKFYEELSLVNEKADDLPRIYIVDYSDVEEHGGGGVSVGNLPTPPSNGMNSIVSQVATVGLQLVTELRNGWITSDSVTNIKKMGILNIRAMLLDEIEKDENGDTDCGFGGALSRPVMFQTRESGAFDLGIVMDITVTLSGFRFHRAQRSCLVVTDS